EAVDLLAERGLDRVERGGADDEQGHAQRKVAPRNHLFPASRTRGSSSFRASSRCSRATSLSTSARVTLSFSSTVQTPPSNDPTPSALPISSTLEQASTWMTIPNTVQPTTAAMCLR